MEASWHWAAYLLTLLLILGLESAVPLLVSSPNSDKPPSNCPFCQNSNLKPRKEAEGKWVFQAPKDPTWYVTTDIYTGERFYCLLVFRTANKCNFGLQYHACSDAGDTKKFETPVNCKNLQKIEVSFNKRKLMIRGLHKTVIFIVRKTLASFNEIHLNIHQLIILDNVTCHFSKSFDLQVGRKYYIKLLFGTSTNIHFKPEIHEAPFRLPDHQWQFMAASIDGNETLFVYSNKESPARIKSTLPSLTMNFDDSVLWCNEKYPEELASTSKASSYSLTTRTLSPTTEASSSKESHTTETNPNTTTTYKVLSDPRATPLAVSPSPNQSLTDASDTGTPNSAREMLEGKSCSRNWIPYVVLAFLVPCLLYIWKPQRVMEFFAWLKGITVRCFKLMPSQEHQQSPSCQDTRGRGSRDSSIFEIIAVYDTEEAMPVDQGTLGSDARLSGSLQDKEQFSPRDSQHGIDLKTDKDTIVLPSDEVPNEVPVTLQSDISINDSLKEGGNPRNPSVDNHDIQTTKLEGEDGFHKEK